MIQYVKWDFDTSQIIRGPQMSPGDGDHWYALVEQGSVVNHRTQQVIYAFDIDTNCVVATVEGRPKLLYDQARRLDYGSLGKQLDMLWHDINNDTLDKTGAFYNYIKEIKEKNPK